MNVTKYEQETIILFNEQEAAAMFCANDLLVAAEGREAARRLGQYRLEQAGKAAMLADFFLNV